MVKRVKDVINGTESMNPITVSGRRKLKRNGTDTSRTRVSSLGLGTDQISGVLKVFVICFVCHGYLIFRFILLRKNTDIRKKGYPENK